MNIVLWILLAEAVFSAQDLRSTKALSTTIEKTRLTATLLTGYHFNEKAPNGLQVGEALIAPQKIEKQKLVIEASESQMQSGTAYLYVCDDAVTFCDRHAIATGKVKVKKAVAKTNQKVKSHHGFILNDFDGALKKAKKEQKILLVDFGARWCPACLRLENEIFRSEDFKKKAKEFVKVKLDVDLFENTVLVEKYQIKGFPTVIFLTTEGQEVLRFMDYQPMGLFHKLIDRVQKNPISIQALEAQLSEELKPELMQRYFESGQTDKAIKLAESLQPKPKEYLSGLISIAEKESPEKLKSVLMKALETEPHSTRSVSWRSRLAEIQKANPKEVEHLAKTVQTLTLQFLSESEKLNQGLLTDTVGEFTSFEKFYVALNFLDFAQSSDQFKNEALELAVSEGQKAKINANHPGTSLRYLGVLIEAKKLPEALKLVDSLLSKNKNDGDLQRRKMRVLVGLEDYRAAIPIGEKALKNSYGINEYYVVENLAKAYKGSGQIQKAKDLVNLYLTKNEIQFPRLAGTKKRLNEINLELQKL